jgi:hypothetical protein
VASRRSGEVTQCRQNCDADEDDQSPRYSESPLVGPALQKKKHETIILEFVQHLPCMGWFPEPARNNVAMADNHNSMKANKHNGTKANITMARRPISTTA